MSFETGAPPPPPPLPEHLPPAQVVHGEDKPADVRLQDGRSVHAVPAIRAVRPAGGHDSTSAILMGLPPGTRTYVLRATETTETTD